MRTFRYSIEQVVDWHPRSFLEPHVVACVSVMARYSESPATFTVECEGITRWLGRDSQFLLELQWSRQTQEKASRIRSTVQSRPLVEMAATAIAMVIASRVLRLKDLDVTRYGDRADFRSVQASCMLEVSGTQSSSQFARRHREKVVQAMKNPFGWDAYVIVCAFSSSGHSIRLSYHSAKEIKDD